MNRVGFRYGFGLAAMTVLGLLLADPAMAQRVNSSGQAPVTDVTGTAITSGDMVSGMFMGTPGPVQTFSCPEATGVRNEGHLLQAELSRGAMWVMVRTPGHRLASSQGGAGSVGWEERQSLLPGALQEDLLGLLSHDDRRSEVVDRIATGLASSSGDASGNERMGRQLAEAMAGLLSSATRMDVHDPGHETATVLTRAVARYNGFVNASSGEFLEAPPEELLAIEAILSRLVIAAMDTHGNAAACGGPLPALAPPSTAAAPSPPPPPAPERAVSVCVWTERGPRDVAAILDLHSGALSVASDGERRPLTHVYPDEIHRAGAALAERDDPIEHRGREYVRFGVPHGVAADGMVVGGTLEGIPLIHGASTDSSPEVIYLPVGEGCLAQPYELQEEVSQVRG
jgi:hypothetical protein